MKSIQTTISRQHTTANHNNNALEQPMDHLLPPKAPVGVRHYTVEYTEGAEQFTVKGQAWLFEDGTTAASIDRILDAAGKNREGSIRGTKLFNRMYFAVIEEQNNYFTKKSAA